MAKKASRKKAALPVPQGRKRRRKPDDFDVVPQPDNGGPSEPMPPMPPVEALPPLRKYEITLRDESKVVLEGHFIFETDLGSLFLTTLLPDKELRAVWGTCVGEWKAFAEVAPAPDVVGPPGPAPVPDETSGENGDDDDDDADDPSDDVEDDEEEAQGGFQ